ncbi:hypothetical protein, partial [Arsenophonus nasoniae]|uniref:hypothetical protein n=1 Tax=Arsenophonus nasoniae TaxID=638 RepID=UPI003879C5D3
SGGIELLLIRALLSRVSLQQLLNVIKQICGKKPMDELTQGRNMSYIVLSTLTKWVPGLASRVLERTLAAISGFFTSVITSVTPL